jgi:hypothetical protein
MNLIIFEKVWIEVERPSLSERPPLFKSFHWYTRRRPVESERTNARLFHFKSYADKIQLNKSWKILDLAPIFVDCSSKLH